MARKKISTTIYVEKDQDTALRKLRDRTGIPTAVLIRDAIDMALLRWTEGGETEEVLAKVEDALAEVRQTEPSPHAAYEDLDLVLTHARQLQNERDQCRALADHYRQALFALQETVKAALSPPERFEPDYDGQEQAEAESALDGG